MKTPTTRKQHTGYRRHQILDAALSCFLEQGVEATTIEQIRKASGASLGSIYHHFGSKEAIALAVYAETIKEYHAQLLAVLDEQTTAQDGIRALISAHLEWVQSNATRAVYLTRVEIADPSGATAGRIAAILQGFFQAVYEWLKPFIERGDLIALAPALYPPLVFGPVASFARHWLTHRMDVDRDLVADTLALAAWNSLRPAPGEGRRPARRKATG